VPRPRAYLDHNATTPLHPAAREAMCAAFDLRGNASSVHAEGRAARLMIEEARADLAASSMRRPECRLYVRRTEALNLALTPHMQAGGAKAGLFDVLLAGAGEHAAVLSGIDSCGGG